MRELVSLNTVRILRNLSHVDNDDIKLRVLIEYFRLVLGDHCHEPLACHFLFNLPAVLLYEKDNSVVSLIQLFRFWKDPRVQALFSPKLGVQASSDSEASVLEEVPVFKRDPKHNRLKKHKSEEIPAHPKKKRNKPRLFYSKKSLGGFQRSRKRRKENPRLIRLEPVHKKASSISCSLQGRRKVTAVHGEPESSAKSVQNQIFRRLKKHLLMFRNESSEKVRLFLARVVLDVYSVVEQAWILGGPDQTS